MADAQALVGEGVLKGKLRDSLRELLGGFERWRAQLGREGHVLTLQVMLDESGYTEMWRQDKSVEAPGRLENLREFVRALGLQQGAVGVSFGLPCFAIRFGRMQLLLQFSNTCF